MVKQKAYKPEASGGKIMNLLGKTLLNITLDEKEAKESGLSREYLQKAMFDSINLKCISKEEKAIYLKIMNIFLDRTFPN